jgi:hypothetical protein
MNWTAVANAHHYDIRMREQGSSAWTITINNVSGAATSQLNSNLTQSTTYDWEVRSACSAGSGSVSAWSTTQSFTTLTPCVVPSNPVTSGIALDVATLDWDVVSGAGAYVVRYKQTAQGWGAWIYDTVTTNTLSLSGLTQGTYYHWQVASMCDLNGNNTSPFSSYTTFITGSCNLVLTINQDNVGCFGGSDGAIDLSISGGSGSYTYLWDDGSTSEDLSGLSAGTYAVVVTDTWGCTGSTSVTITEPATPFSIAIQSAGSATVCSGSSVLLTMTTYASTLNTYQWNDASGPITGETTSMYTALVSGTYNLTVTNPNGCVATSNDIVVDIITVTAPIGLFTSNIGLDNATMNWTAVANAHHYDIRMREQGSTAWTITINNVSAAATSQLKSNLTQ